MRLQKKLLPDHPSLPPDNPCYGCLANCCDPVRVNAIKPVLFPLDEHDPRQNGTPENIAMARAATLRAIEKVRDQLIPTLSQDGRFSFHGALLQECHGSDAIVQYTTESATSHEDDLGIIIAANTDNMAAVFGYMHAAMAYVRTYVRFYLTCSAFHRPSGMCAAYETRPELCRCFDHEKCGFSQVSPPYIYADDEEGRDVSKKELADSYRMFRGMAKPSVAEAVGSYIARLRTYPPR